VLGARGAGGRGQPVQEYGRGWLAGPSLGKSEDAAVRRALRPGGWESGGPARTPSAAPYIGVHHEGMFPREGLRAAPDERSPSQTEVRTRLVLSARPGGEHALDP